MRVIRTLLPLCALSLSCALPVNSQANWFEKGLELYQQNSQASSPTSSASSSQFSSAELEQAFRQALSLGSENVLAKLGLENGFNQDPKVHIRLPESLQSVDRVLKRVGYASLTSDLELKLNRAAEAAAPEAKTLFLETIQQMSFEDVREIYQGGPDSATQFLKSKTADKIRSKMAPIVSEKLQEVGALQLYDQVMAQYMRYPLVPNLSANLQQHVLDKSVDGIFLYLGEEEKAIRENPTKQATELLKRVFQP
ncbi:MAG: DUF4197 domain-containing protein [Thiotrichales bacterium]|nr:DUF4197 domain-containing protein [Thiotrichales bacterium]